MRSRHGNPIDSPMLQWKLEEKPRPHSDFTEIMLLLRDGFLLFHTFFRLYNAGQMFFGGATSKKNHS